MSKRANFKKRELFNVKTFCRFIGWCDFEFFRQTAERFKDKWTTKYGKYQLKYSSHEEPICWPLLTAVKNDFVEHAQILIKAGHPHRGRCFQSQFIISFVQSIEMFQLLIEHGVEFKLSTAYWPDEIPLSKLSDQSTWCAKECLDVKSLKYILRASRYPICQSEAYEIFHFFLSEFLNRKQDVLRIDYDIFKLMITFVRLIPPKIMTHSIIYSFTLGRQWHGHELEVCMQALMMLSYLGVVRISDVTFSYGPNVNKLLVHSHSFVDALIEYDALKAEETEDE
jgi:hypothetical protein